MTESSSGAPPDDGMQDPLVHESGQSEDLDTNERGDDKATVQQPSGGDAPDASAE